jgi:hypothetical protein
MVSFAINAARNNPLIGIAPENNLAVEPPKLLERPHIRGGVAISGSNTIGASV